MIPQLVVITAADRRIGPGWVRALDLAPRPGLLVRSPHLSRAELEAVIAEAKSRLPFVSVHTSCVEAAEVARRHGVYLHVPSRPDRWPDVPFGASTHDGAEVERVFRRGASYAFLSPVWRPASKQDDARVPLGLAGYLAIARRAGPLLALGGVSDVRFRELVAAGGYGAAVLGAFDVPDPGPALTSFWHTPASRQNTNSAS